MNDVTLQEMLAFLEYEHNATVMDVMAEFDLTEPEALEALQVTKRFLQRPREEQTAILRLLTTIQEHRQ